MSTTVKESQKQIYSIILHEGTSTPLSKEFEEKFARNAHIHFALTIDDKKDTFEYYATEHLRMNGIYWTIMALDLMGASQHLDKQKIIEFVQACYDSETGGYSANINHDVHLLNTMSAIQILAIFDSMHLVDVEKTISYLKSLQRDDGAFMGDSWGEIDTRFSYLSLNILALLHKLGDESEMVNKAVQFIAKCRNFDGGFGASPGAESHAGQIFCCIASLAIVNKIDEYVDKDVLGWLLCERQLPCGGLNGRPEKKEDVCYSWWVFSSLSLLKRVEWIDKEKLGKFILASQDINDGGISDRPGNMTDIFHTYFGIAGLSLLGFPGFEEIDSAYALPKRVVERMG